jgi:ATP synthase protein I
MTDDKTDERTSAEPEFASRVGTRAALKLQALRSNQATVGFGLGMMGLIGWSVVVPTLLGAFAGIWMDRHSPGQKSWTLALLVAGLVLGCFNAWNWVAKEDAAIHERKGAQDD